MSYDITLIICLIATHAVAAVTPLILRDQLWYAKKMGTMKRLKEQEKLFFLSNGELADTGLVATPIEPNYVSVEEHEKILKKKYSQQLKEYNEHKREVHERMDRYVLRLLIEYENGNIKITRHGPYTIEFNNGDEIWVGNKYYCYGRLYKSSQFPGLAQGSNYHVSPYTFLRVVELEDDLSDPSRYFTKAKTKLVEFE